MAPQKGQKISKSKKKKQEEEERRQREEGHSYLSFFLPSVKPMIKKILDPTHALFCVQRKHD